MCDHILAKKLNSRKIIMLRNRLEELRMKRSLKSEDSQSSKRFFDYRRINFCESTTKPQVSVIIDWWSGEDFIKSANSISIQLTTLHAQLINLTHFWYIY